jgi:hypothetical protein
VTEQPQQEQIPIESYVAELELEVSQLSREKMLLRTRLRVRDDTIQDLQEQNVALQKRVTDLQDAANLPQPA